MYNNITPEGGRAYCSPLVANLYVIIAVESEIIEVNRLATVIIKSIMFSPPFHGLIISRNALFVKCFL